MIEVIVINNKTEEIVYGYYAARQLLDTTEEKLVEEMTDCDCEPIGETNVVECNCFEEWEDYTLIVGNENNYNNIDYEKARLV
ncbi:MAG: acetyltransferase [Firmicutes bacterium]|nr:acetyltransferase [Bacillota bacterium]